MDVVCMDDLDLGGRELDDPLEELHQDLYHRALEAPGSNLDDVDRGLGLRDRMSGFEDPRLASQVEAEFSKDNRVTSTSATVSPTDDGRYAIDAQVQANGRTLGIDLELAQAEGRIQ